MKWIVITSPDFVPGEATFIDLLFRCGLDLLHLRKPDASVDDCRRLLNEIPREWHNRIVTHDYFQLADEFPLYGVHLNRRNPVPPTGFRGSISRSCHSLDEVMENKPQCNYVFLSPVFNSISKEGYESAFSDEALKQAAGRGIIDNKVVALGGISCDSLPQVRAWGFGGAAFLGDIWQRKDSDDVEEYLKNIASCI